MIYIFLAEGFEEIEALCPLDLMRRAGLEAKTVGVGGEYITGGHAITVRADMTDAEFFKTRWRQGDQFNAIEAETWAYLVAMSGGNIFLSDKMSVLNEKGIELIADAFAAESEEIRPVYLKDDKRLPTLWLSDGKMLLVNWENEPRSISVNVDADNLTSKKKFSLENGILSVTLKPHESFFAVLD